MPLYEVFVPFLFAIERLATHGTLDRHGIGPFLTYSANVTREKKKCVPSQTGRSHRSLIGGVECVRRCSRVGEPQIETVGSALHAVASYCRLYVDDCGRYLGMPTVLKLHPTVSAAAGKRSLGLHCLPSRLRVAVDVSKRIDGLECSDRLVQEREHVIRTHVEHVFVAQHLDDVVGVQSLGAEFD